MYVDVIINSIHFYKKRYVILQIDQGQMNVKKPPMDRKMKNYFYFYYLIRIRIGGLKDEKLK